MKFYLIVAKGSKQGMPIPVTVDLFLIGSDKICQLRKRSLGPKHCAFVTRDKKVFIRDMDSGSPTIVNGAAIPTGGEWPLHSGDRVTVGSLEFLVKFHESPLSKKDLEEWAIHSLDEQPQVEEENDEFLSTKYKTASSAAQSIIDRLNAMKGEVRGRLRIGNEKGVMVVRFNDSMLVDESEIALIKTELCENLNKSNRRVLLDLKNVRRISSVAVRMLADFNRWLLPYSSTMALCRVRSEVESAMSLLRIESVPIFTDKKAALAAKW
jgi:anti-anti-sigma regulatory factor